MRTEWNCAARFLLESRNSLRTKITFKSRLIRRQIADFALHFIEFTDMRYFVIFIGHHSCQLEIWIKRENVLFMSHFFSLRTKDLFFVALLLFCCLNSRWINPYWNYTMQFRKLFVIFFYQYCIASSRRIKFSSSQSHDQKNAVAPAKMGRLNVSIMCK